MLLSDHTEDIYDGDLSVDVDLLMVIDSRLSVRRPGSNDGDRRSPVGLSASIPKDSTYCCEAQVLRILVRSSYVYKCHLSTYNHTR